VKYYSHNVGDWLPATVDLSMCQEGAYRRLMDWYYSNEQPLPLLYADCCRIARASGRGERDAVRLILDRYFTLAEDGWHNVAIDRQIQSYSKNEPARTKKRDEAAARQRRSRERRAASWAALVARGINPPWKATQSVLDELLRKHGITLVVTDSVTRDVQRDAESDFTRDRAITSNQEPKESASHAALSVTAADSRDVVVIAGTASPARVLAAGRALKASGFPMPEANTSDPRFLALLQAGVTDDELRMTGAEAVARSKGWGWLVATIAGRHADVANGYAPRRAANGPNRGDPGRVEGLTPTIAAKPRISPS